MDLSWLEWNDLLDELPNEDVYTPLYIHIVDHTWMYNGSDTSRRIEIPMPRAHLHLLWPVITGLRLREQFRQDRRRFPRDHYAMVVLVDPDVVKQNKRRYRQHRRIFRERVKTRETG